jgi:hypothetical protein
MRTKLMACAMMAFIIALGDPAPKQPPDPGVAAGSIHAPGPTPPGPPG